MSSSPSTEQQANSAAPAQVSAWGELPGEKNAPGLLRVLVAGQHAGALSRDDAGGWIAEWHPAPRPGQVTWSTRRSEHTTADDAVTAVLRSGFARRLGATAKSRVFWTDKARRRAARPIRRAGNA